MSMPERSADAPSEPDRRYDAWDLGEIVAAELGKPKPWWHSRAIIGAAMVMVAQGAKLGGLEIDSAALTDAILSGITLLGAALAWWGRVQASRPISRRDLAPGLRVGAAADSLRTPARPHRPDELPPDAIEDPAGYWRAGRGPFHDS